MKGVQTTLPFLTEVIDDPNFFSFGVKTTPIKKITLPDTDPDWIKESKPYRNGLGELLPWEEEAKK